MEQPKSNLVETLLKVIPLLFTLTGICIGLFQYNENYKREMRKNAYNTAFTIYQDFIEKCAILSHYDKDSTTTAAFNSDYKEFERIYYGKLLIVQDSTVSDKATEFYLGLKKFQQKSTPTSNSDLEVLLYNLINTSKQSLKKIKHEDDPF